MCLELPPRKLAGWEHAMQAHHQTINREELHPEQLVRTKEVHMSSDNKVSQLRSPVQ